MSRDDGRERPDALDGRAVRLRRHLGDSIDLIISSVRATDAELPDCTFDEAAVRPWIGRPFTAMLIEQGVSDHDQWMTIYRRHYRKAHDEMLRPLDTSWCTA